MVWMRASERESKGNNMSQPCLDTWAMSCEGHEGILAIDITSLDWGGKEEGCHLLPRQANLSLHGHLLAFGEAGNEIAQFSISHA